MWKSQASAPAAARVWGWLGLETCAHIHHTLLSRSSAASASALLPQPLPGTHIQICAVSILDDVSPRQPIAGGLWSGQWEVSGQQLRGVGGS